MAILFTINGFFYLDYWWLLMVILFTIGFFLLGLLVAINGYFIYD
jgi:hypothetical protein